MTTKTHILRGAIALAFAVTPALAQAETAFAVTADNQLVTFDLAAPGTLLTQAPIVGLASGGGFNSIFELAYNHATSTLFGLDRLANLYTIDAAGNATLINSGFTPFGFDGGLAYDPFSFGLRFVSDAAENAVLNLDGSVTLGANVFYAAEDVNAAATPSFAGFGIDPDFGTAFAIDPVLDTLAVSYSPDASEYFTIGGLGVDITGYASLDVTNLGFIYAALSEDAATSALYTIDSVTGEATKVDDFGVAINAIAVPEPATGLLLAGSALLLLGRRRRA